MHGLTGNITDREMYLYMITAEKIMIHQYSFFILQDAIACFSNKACLSARLGLGKERLLGCVWICVSFLWKITVRG